MTIEEEELPIGRGNRENVRIGRPTKRIKD
jgi:hypothetical protein